MEELVIDVGDDDFEQRVIERSKQIPVIVDFWAEWCGPCKALGPLLERLVAEQGGAVMLAKVDVDQAPGLAGAFGVRSIPMVVGFRDGGIAAQFVGALPEEQLREFLASLLPSEAEKVVARATALRDAGQRAEATDMYRRALELDRRCELALLELARTLIEDGNLEEVPALLDQIGPGTPLRNQADRLAAGLRVSEAVEVDEAGLLQAIANSPDDHESRLRLAHSFAAATRYPQALEQYLEIVKRDRTFRDEAARKAMLDIFEILGSDHQTTQQYRSELAKVLFS